MLFENDHAPIITELIYIEEPARSDWSFPLHQHGDRLETSFVVEGCIDCYFEGMTKRLSAGDLLIKNAGVIHAEKAIGDTGLQEICVSFDQIHVSGLPENHLVPEDQFPILHADREPVIRELFLYLKNHQSDPDDFQKTELARTIITLLCHHMTDMAAGPHDQKGDLTQTIQDVKEYLDKNYSRKISLDALGEKFYISPFYLTRQFKKKTGYTVKQYILELQMGEAEKLLLFTDLPVKEIALKCGYDNLQYFYVQFKKYARFTPVEYRKQYKKNLPKQER